MLRRRRLLIVLSLGAAVSLPIVIGASCPSPSDPFYLSLGATPAGASASPNIPECIPDYVCISVINTTFVNVDVALYVHDGFDPLLQYPVGFATSCCPNPNTAVTGCPCPAPGYQVGELQLSRPQLFAAGTPLPPNLYTRVPGVSSPGVRRLPAFGGSMLVQVQEGDIKSFGMQTAIATGPPSTLLTNPAVTQGPYYRCSVVAITDTGAVSRLPEDLPAGQTFQFVIRDQLEGVMPGTAALVVLTSDSWPQACPPVQPSR